VIGVVNLGLKSVRFVVFDDAGRKVAFSSRPLHTTLGARTVEQDANEWLRLVREVVLECGRIAPVGEISAIGVTASASCLVAVSADGIPLGPVLMVSDSRCQREAAEVEARLADAHGTRTRVGTDMMLPKAVWIERRSSDLRHGARWYLSPADFLLFHLSGEVVTDSLTASKFLFDPLSWCYPSLLCSELHLDERKLPTVRHPGDVIGFAVGRAAREIGLRPDCALVLGTYDAICGVLGSGVAAPGTAAVVSGTVTSVRALLPGSTTSSGRGLYQGPWIEDGLHLIGGSNNFGGGLVEWHKQAFYRGGVPDVYECMDRDARSVGPGADGMIFLPYLLGERAPLWDPNVRAVFFGIDRHHGREHFTRAVFESVAFSARHILEHIEEAGAEITDVRFSGGLSRIPMICRIVADVLQKDVQVPDEFETTSVGAWVLCRWGLGGRESTQLTLASALEGSTMNRPDKSVAALYNRLFEMYLHLYRDLVPSTARHTAIMNAFPSALDANPQTRENL
jgi:xylulokinase